MRQNYSGNKRRKEELRKKKQEAKRNKRQHKQTQDPQPGPVSSGRPEVSPVSLPKLDLAKFGLPIKKKPVSQPLPPLPFK